MEIKRLKNMTDEEWKRFEESQRKLLERIAYHETKIEEERAAQGAARPAPASSGRAAAPALEIKRPRYMTDEEWERYGKSQRKLAERIAYHERKIEEERARRAESDDR